MLRTLEDDFRRIPELIAEEAGEPAQIIQFPAAASQVAAPAVEQLGLF
jgi:hypothetical protein